MSDDAVSSDEDVEAAPSEANDARWCDYLREEIRACPAYAEHAELLEECCDIAARWRDRFCERTALWSRIRRGSRLSKELAEVVPVVARCIAEVSALTLPEGGQQICILDLCSGFGYLAMFLSELLPPAKVEKIVLVDIRWAPHSIEPRQHHLDREHLDADGWPIRLTTSRCDLKTSSDRRNLLRTFAAQGAPVLMLGVHLCGTLSLRAVEMFNESPSATHLALKPCCLPAIAHAQRGVLFNVGGHSFPACAVCANGRWRRGRWCGSAGREEVERKFHTWAAHLCRGVEERTGCKALEVHRVQAAWFQNSFVFCSRTFSPQPPESVVAFLEERRADEAAAARSLLPGESVAEGAARLRRERQRALESSRARGEDVRAREERKREERAAREAAQREQRLSEKRRRRQQRREEVAQGLRPPPPDALQLVFDFATLAHVMTIIPAASQ